MKKSISLIFLFLLFSANVYAAPTGWQTPTELVGGAMDDALKQISTALEKSVLAIIFALALLQAAVQGFKQLASGEIEKPILAVGMNLGWVGLALWFLGSAANPMAPGMSNLANLLYWIQNFATSIVSNMTGAVEFSAGAIFSIGLQSYGQVTLAITKAMSTNAVNVAAALFVPGVSFMTALMTFFVSVVIMLSCAYIAVKVFITKIEFAILVAIAPLNVALIVFGPTREQGWAPFKGALALVYRVIILGGTVAAIAIVAQSLSDYVGAQTWGIVADVWTPLISAAFAFCLIAFVAHKSDSIASSMASGTSNLSSGDLAGSISAGVAAGLTGAAALGAATAAASGGTGVKAMADVMKNMNEASPVARGAQAIKSSLGLGGGADKAPQKPHQPSYDKMPPPPPTSKAAGDNTGKTTVPAPSPTLPGTTPEPEQSPSSTQTGGSGTTAGIGGAADTPQTPEQEKMMAAIGKLMDQGGKLSQKAERDTGSVGVNINTHHGLD